MKDNRDLNEIYEYFRTFGANPKLELHMDSSGNAASLMFDARAELSVDLYNYQTTYFANDIRRLRELTAEERLRKENPVLERAYEDYQILLKLSK